MDHPSRLDQVHHENTGTEIYRINHENRWNNADDDSLYSKHVVDVDNNCQPFASENVALRRASSEDSSTRRLVQSMQHELRSLKHNLGILYAVLGIAGLYILYLSTAPTSPLLPISMRERFLTFLDMQTDIETQTSPILSGRNLTDSIRQNKRGRRKRELLPQLTFENEPLGMTPIEESLSSLMEASSRQKSVKSKTTYLSRGISRNKSWSSFHDKVKVEDEQIVVLHDYSENLDLGRAMLKRIKTQQQNQNQVLISQDYFSLTFGQKHPTSLAYQIPKNHETTNNSFITDTNQHRQLQKFQEVTQDGSSTSGGVDSTSGDCSDGSKFRVELTTDMRGNETSWHLMEVRSKQILLNVTAGTYPNNIVKMYDYETCLPTDGVYAFTIHDENGDGMSKRGANNGGGAGGSAAGVYVLLADGKRLVAGENFEFITSHVVEVATVIGSDGIESIEATLLQPTNYCAEKPVLNPINKLSNYTFDGRIYELIMVMTSVSGTDFLMDSDSARYKAACWVLYDDLRKFRASDTMFLQRYVSALFYFSSYSERITYVRESFGRSEDECDFFNIKPVDAALYKFQKQYPYTCENGNLLKLEIVSEKLQGPVMLELSFLKSLREFMLALDANTNLAVVVLINFFILQRL